MEAVAASIVFAVALVIIFSDWIHRTIVAMGGAVAMVIVGRLLGFYTETEALEAIDFDTIGLLLGMMIVVALLQPTGFFEYLALYAGRLSGGRPFRLFLLLGAVTSVLSMFLDNVTTIVVIAPVTLVIAQVLKADPVPLLISEAMLSNVAGIATLVGDPPNILIGSAADLSFNDFLTHELPVVAPVWVITVGFLWLLFRSRLTRSFGGDAGDQGDGTCDQGGRTGDQGDGACDQGGRTGDQGAVARLDPSDALLQPAVARKVLIVLAGTVVLFFLQELLHISPAFVALGAAAIALLLVRPNVRDTLHHVEWPVLLFFAALFVMVGGLEQAGVLERIADVLARGAGLPTVLLGVVLIWAVALISAVVDNIPITIALIPVIAGLESSGIEIGPLWWALALGAGLGGNATVIGASANVVVVSVSERSGSPIGSREWMRWGIPTMLVTCTAASIFYVLLFPLIQR